MALNKRTALFISYGIMSIAWLLLVISNIVPRWGVAGGGSLEVTLGLWQLCEPTILGPQVCGAIQCTSAASVCGKLTAARLFLTVACISAAISVLLLIICIVRTANKSPIICIVRAANTPPILLRLTKGIPFVSFVTGLIGVATGIAFVNDSLLYSVGAGAILGIVAVIINLAGAIMTIMIPGEYQSV